MRSHIPLFPQAARSTDDPPPSGRSTPSQPPSDRWIATDGIVALGPVTMAALLRETALGKLHPGALARHESWQVWRRLADLTHLSGQDRERTTQSYADLSATLHERASGPHSIPPPPPSSAELTAAANDSVAP